MSLCVCKYHLKHRAELHLGFMIKGKSLFGNKQIQIMCSCFIQSCIGAEQHWENTLNADCDNGLHCHSQQTENMMSLLL